ncbi:hypothetical protein DFH08DRAFT_814467 [Mycena albidolilacea]|uniref:Uncharacterized protein n=1 Tax=Mycena albidolilacea TaxID=1033008 RepID=A0AAD7EKK6_9AGAR|nr:hypothetical protein DFH08DRAFT_814467 [Mycena albidolilacea]
MVDQIRFQIDNSKTNCWLIPAITSAFADWGHILRKPVAVPPRSSIPENGGVVKASSAPFIGAAMIVVYLIKTSTPSPIYVCLLGSDPDLSARSNWAYVYITTDMNEAKADQDLYNKVYFAERTSASVKVDGGIFQMRASSVVPQIN